MHHTNHVTVTLKVPKQKAKTFLVPLAAHHSIQKFLEKNFDNGAIEKSYPANKVLPELADDILRPAAMLRGCRAKAKLTQKSLAEKLGVLQHHLSEMENGKRSIGKQMAKKLAAVFKSDYRLFI